MVYIHHGSQMNLASKKQKSSVCIEVIHVSLATWRGTVDSMSQSIDGNIDVDCTYLERESHDQYVMQWHSLVVLQEK